jgi:esterase/lipase
MSILEERLIQAYKRVKELEEEKHKENIRVVQQATILELRKKLSTVTKALERIRQHTKWRPTKTDALINDISIETLNMIKDKK